MIRLGGLLAAALVLLAMGGPPAEGRAGEAGEVVAGEVLVLPRTEPLAAGMVGRARLGALGAPRGGVQRLRVPVGEERARAAALRRDPDVAAAAPNFRRRAMVAPNDPLFTSQWHLTRIEALTGWEVARGSSAVTVAVLDSGVDPDHPDLRNRLLPGTNTLTTVPAPPGGPPPLCAENRTVRDDFYHGTHVAGVIGASTDDGVGVAGVDWAARLLPVKVLNCVGFGNDDELIAGIDYAIGQGARVLNLSIGGPGQSPVLDAAVERAWRAGALVIAAAGNDRTSEPYYPAASPFAIAVTATDRDDQFAASFSNWGSYVRLAAPGVGILSTYPTYMGAWHVQPGYLIRDGTSFAAPQVAGLAALLWSRYPTASQSRIAGLMYVSARKLPGCAHEVTSCSYDEHGRNAFFGHGRISVGQAMRVGYTAVVPMTPLRAALGEGLGLR